MSIVVGPVRGLAVPVLHPETQTAGPHRGNSRCKAGCRSGTTPPPSSTTQQPQQCRKAMDPVQSRCLVSKAPTAYHTSPALSIGPWYFRWAAVKPASRTGSGVVGFLVPPKAWPGIVYGLTPFPTRALSESPGAPFHFGKWSDPLRLSTLLPDAHDRGLSLRWPVDHGPSLREARLPPLLDGSITQRYSVSVSA
jgi:hypothetical protein